MGFLIREEPSQLAQDSVISRMGKVEAEEDTAILTLKSSLRDLPLLGSCQILSLIPKRVVKTRMCGGGVNFLTQHLVPSLMQKRRRKRLKKKRKKLLKQKSVPGSVAGRISLK